MLVRGWRRTCTRKHCSVKQRRYTDCRFDSSLKCCLFLISWEWSTDVTEWLTCPKIYCIVLFSSSVLGVTGFAVLTYCSISTINVLSWFSVTFTLLQWNHFLNMKVWWLTSHFSLYLLCPLPCDCFLHPKTLSFNIFGISSLWLPPDHQDLTVESLQMMWDWMWLHPLHKSFIP